MALSQAQTEELVALLRSTDPAGKVDGNSASALLAFKPQASALAITYTANDPGITANGAVTVADGAVPTVAELLELIEEIIQLLKAAGIMAS